MSHSVVGKWGKNLAIRVPTEIARAAGLADGERVEVQTQDGDLIIRRSEARARSHQDAEAAADEIAAASRQYTLGDASIRDLLEDGRRG
jgi:antitoxin component of MazEF toxin-antitoxin module